MANLQTSLPGTQCVTRPPSDRLAILRHLSLSFQTPCLHTMGNIVAGTNEQTQMAIDAGMLKVLGQVLRHPKSSIQKLAAWAMSNVAAGPTHHVQQLILCNLLPVLVNLLRNVSGRAGKRVSKASVVRHKDLSSIPRAHRKTREAG